MSFRQRIQQKLVAIILRRIVDPEARRIGEQVLQSGWISRLRSGSVLIPASLIVDELNRQAEAVPGLHIYECRVTGEKIILEIGHDSIGDLRPVIGIRFSDICVNDKVQTITLKYELNDSLDYSLLTYVFRPLIRLVASVFIKRRLSEIDVLEGFSHTDSGGWIKVDLAKIEEFRRFQIIPGFNHRVFSLFTFSTIRHSAQGIEIVSDTTFRQFAVNLYRLLTKNKTPI